jgi:hypothetical protein
VKLVSIIRSDPAQDNAHFGSFHFSGLPLRAPYPSLAGVNVPFGLEFPGDMAA